MNTIPVKVHNRFDFELADAKTGEVKQKCTCYNIVLDQYFRRLVSNSSTINAIMLGTGTGTPVVTRTSLFSYLIRKDATLVESHIAYILIFEAYQPPAGSIRKHEKRPLLRRSRSPKPQCFQRFSDIARTAWAIGFSINHAVLIWWRLQDSNL